MGVGAIKARILGAKRHEVTFLNSTYFNALCLTHCMFDHAAHSLSIVFDIGVLRFLSELREPFGCAVRRIGNTRILVLVPHELKQVGYIRETLGAFGSTVAIRIKTPQPTVSLRNAILADERHYRLEALHREITDESPTDAFSSKVVFNGRKGLWLQNQFDVLFELNDSKYILKEHK